jgi:hypothetical protein
MAFSRLFVEIRQGPFKARRPCEHKCASHVLMRLDVLTTLGRAMYLRWGGYYSVAVVMDDPWAMLDGHDVLRQQSNTQPVKALQIWPL